MNIVNKINVKRQNSSYNTFHMAFCFKNKVIIFQFSKGKRRINYPAIPTIQTINILMYFFLFFSMCFTFVITVHAVKYILLCNFFPQCVLHL